MGKVNIENLSLEWQRVLFMAHVSQERLELADSAAVLRVAEDLSSKGLVTCLFLQAGDSFGLANAVVSRVGASFPLSLDPETRFSEDDIHEMDKQDKFAAPEELDKEIGGSAFDTVNCGAFMYGYIFTDLDAEGLLILQNFCQRLANYRAEPYFQEWMRQNLVGHSKSVAGYLDRAL